MQAYHFEIEGQQRTLMQAYLSAWFRSDVAIQYSCNVSQSYVLELEELGLVPGPAYQTCSQGKVWSALSEYLGHSHICRSSEKRIQWFSPAMVSWIRKIRLVAGRNPEEISARFEAEFHDDYSMALSQLPGALQDYARDIEDAAHAWDAWIRGAYAVCMKSFSAGLVVEKLSRRLRAQALLSIGTSELSRDEKRILLEDTTRLSEILTPFSPLERASGTPGTVIDRCLAELSLGTENPFPAPTKTRP